MFSISYLPVGCLEKSLLKHTALYPKTSNMVKTFKRKYGFKFEFPAFKNPQDGLLTGKNETEQYYKMYVLFLKIERRRCMRAYM